jgi:hypothetical protein
LTEQSTPPGNVGPLHDYLYVDRTRIAALHTQLLGYGVPLQSKYSQSATKEMEKGSEGGVPKIFAGKIGSKQSETDGTEFSYDLAWPMILDTLDVLSERGDIQEPKVGTTVGSLIRIHGRLSLVDLRVMRDLWGPMMKMMTSTQKGQKKSAPGGIAPANIAEFAKFVPHPLVVQLITSDKPEDEPYSVGPESLNAWGVLATEHVIGDSATFSLMNGGFLPSEYTMIAVLDVGSTPDAPFVDPFSAFSPTNTFEMMLQMQQFLRNMFGRPNYANGVTPLAIYRTLTRGENDTP